MGEMQTWQLRSKGIREIVRAPDQFAALDTLQHRSIMDFGLVVSAEPDENSDPFSIQTETLMRRWGREDDAAAFYQLAVEKGLK